MHRSAAANSYMRGALALAERGYGLTSPNPMVGAVLVKAGKVIGRGWHRGAGQPHAEVEALRDAERLGNSVRGATLYVTLEPCCTHGRTPPCTEAILGAGITSVVVAATDPNPRHAGRGFEVLRRGGIKVTVGLLASEAESLNAAFNHWIVHRTPFITVKAAMSLDGKIATRTGQSKWITGPESRAVAMRIRQGSDAILVGVNTVMADDPSLTVRDVNAAPKQPRRVVLDSSARTPLNSRVVADEHAARTVVVTAEDAPSRRVAALSRKVAVWTAPRGPGGIDLRWLMSRLGAEDVTSLLVEGGGEVNASFLFEGFAHRVAFWYAPKIIGGRDAPKSVAAIGVTDLREGLKLHDVAWQRVGEDLLLTAAVLEH